MIEVHPLLILFMAELLFVTTIGMIIMVVMGTLKKRRDRAAASSLIDRIKSDEERRKKETREILKEKYGMADEPVESSSVLIDHGEKFLYQTMINTYLNRDTDALENFAVDYESSVAPYRDMTISTAEVKVIHKESEAAPQEVLTDHDAEELKILRKDNARLSEELRITMDTMSRMLNEYASMYGGGSGAELDKDKMIKMFQAEREAEEAAVSAVSIEADGDEIRLVDNVAEEASEVESEETDSDLDLLVDDEGVKEAAGELDDVDWDEVEQDILETQPEASEVEQPIEEEVVSQEMEPSVDAVAEPDMSAAAELPEEVTEEPEADAVEAVSEEEIPGEAPPLETEPEAEEVVDDLEDLDLGDDLQDEEEDEVVDLDEEEDDVIDLDGDDEEKPKE